MDDPKMTVVVSVAAADPQAMLEAVEAAVVQGAGAIELRLDALVSLDWGQVRGLVGAAATRLAGRPLIVTCRDASEGGMRGHPLDQRLLAYQAAVGAGADWIDIELANYTRPEVARPISEAIAARSGTRLILSAHSWDGPFKDLQAVYLRAVEAAPQAVPKLVYTARHITDCLPGLDLLARRRGELVLFCMGQAGQATRVLAGKLGSLFTYACMDQAQATAPGQIGLAHMLRTYRFERLGPRTEVFGLVGDPVAHSVGPWVYNACFDHLGLDCVYLPLLVGGAREGFHRFMQGLLARPWLDVRGLSVTLPHKHSALELVDLRGGRVDPLAARIGSVNTVLIRPDGALEAYNTDYVGAMEAIYEGLGVTRSDIRGWPVAVVGAGGVARAVVAGLVDARADVTIFNRTAAKAQDLAGAFGCRWAELSRLSQADPRLIVNCTSVGMHPDVEACPVPDGILRPQVAVFDTVYNPLETTLLRRARQHGCICIDGLCMYAHQAAAQVRLFTGRQVDVAMIRQLALERLAAGTA